MAAGCASDADVDEEDADDANAPLPALMTLIDKYRCDSSQPIKDEADLAATCKVMLQVAQKSISASRSLLNARASANRAAMD